MWMWHNKDLELPCVPLIGIVVDRITLLPHTTVRVIKRQLVKHIHHLQQINSHTAYQSRPALLPTCINQSINQSINHLFLEKSHQYARTFLGWHRHAFTICAEYVQFEDRWLVSSWFKNISVSFCLRAPGYGLTLWCALGLLVGAQYKCLSYSYSYSYRYSIHTNTHSQTLSQSHIRHIRKAMPKTARDLLRIFSKETDFQLNMQFPATYQMSTHLNVCPRRHRFSKSAVLRRCGNHGTRSVI